MLRLSCVFEKISQVLLRPLGSERMKGNGPCTAVLISDSRRALTLVKRIRGVHGTMHFEPCIAADQIKYAGWYSQRK
jgi:hypothetical protein